MTGYLHIYQFSYYSFFLIVYPFYLFIYLFLFLVWLFDHITVTFRRDISYQSTQRLNHGR